MPLTKKQTYEKVARLVERFDERVEEYKPNAYIEHQTRNQTTANKAQHQSLCKKER